MKIQPFFIVLVLFCSLEMFAQDPHRVPDSQITAENFYNALSMRNERAMRAEVHPEIGWELTIGKVVEYLFASQETGVNIKLYEMEYEPLENDRIRVTGMYSVGGDKVAFVHLWQLKERKLMGLSHMDSPEALTKSDVKH